MRYLSLFSGIGGFELGIQLAHENLFPEKEAERIRKKDAKAIRIEAGSADHERNTGLASGGAAVQQHAVERATGQPACIGFSEIDKYASQIYQSHFPNHKAYGDITKINADELPDFDLLCGGFPCQSFSIAGKRGGFSDTRGTMFFEIARILKAKQPRLLLLENVKGLLSHDEGRTFATIIATLDELGYDLQWQVLNSKNFGVPQNRERIFIIGHLRGTSRPEVFPFGGNSSENIEVCGKPQQTANTLVSTYARNQSDGQYVALDSAGVQEIATAIDANYHKGHGQRGQSRGRTLAGNGLRIRRLTPTECERLQGFPDGWTAKGAKEVLYSPSSDLTHEYLPFDIVEISDTQKYKTLGNAVTVNVIKAIAEKLL